MAVLLVAFFAQSDEKKSSTKDTKAEKPEAKEAAKGEVYLTASGSRYHADGCRFLAKSKIPCTLADAKAKKHEPCSVCKPPK